MREKVKILIVVLIGASVGIANVLITGLLENDIPRELKLTMFTALVLTAVCYYYIKFRDKDILSPVYLISACFLVIFGCSIYSDIYLSSKYFYVICISYIALYLGMELGRFYYPKRKTLQEIPQWDVHRVFMLGRLMFFISFILFIYYANQYGIAIFSTNIDEARTLATYGKANGYLTNLAFYFFAPVAILFFRYILSSETPKSIRLKMTGYYVLCILIYLSSGARHEIFIVLVSSLLIYHYSKKKLNLNHLLIVFTSLLSAGALVQIIRINRDLTFQTLFKTIFTELKVISYNLSLILDYYNPVNFLKGKGLLMGFSVVLPGRQVDMSLFLKEYFHMNFTGGGLTPSIIGSFYVDFGYIGIVVGMAVFGFICTSLYNGMLHNKNTFHIIIYAISITYLLISIRNGALYSPITFSHIILIFVLNKLLCFKFKSKARRCSDEKPVIFSYNKIERRKLSA